LCYIGTQLPSPNGGGAPQFSARICCGQMAGWIKIALGREVGFSLSDIVLDGDPAPPPPKWGGASEFSDHICCRQTAGWIKMPLGMEVDLSRGHILLDGTQLPPRKEHSSPPPFSAHIYCGHGRPSQLLLSSCTICIFVLLCFCN